VTLTELLLEALLQEYVPCYEDDILDLAEDITRLTTMINILENLNIECSDLKKSLNNYMNKWISLFVPLPRAHEALKYVKYENVKPLWRIIDYIGEDELYELLVKMYSYYELYTTANIDEEDLREIEKTLYILWDMLVDDKLEFKVNIHNLDIAFAIMLHILSASTLK